MERMLSHATTRFVVSALSVLCSVTSSGCGGDPDPRTLEGATAYATLAVQEADGQRLFRVIDARARHAMISIVNDRRRQRELIERSYPEAERAPAIAALGDAGAARDAPDLFARRCDARCMGELRDTLGAPVSTRREGEITVAHTTRDADVMWYRKRDGDWWGLVWRTDALIAERDRANRDLTAIAENSATYDRRRQLETP
jgi:hypothetical protein